MDDTPKTSTSMLTLLCCPGKVRGLLFLGLHLVRDRDSSLGLMTPASVTVGKCGRMYDKDISPSSTPLNEKWMAGQAFHTHIFSAGSPATPIMCWVCYFKYCSWLVVVCSSAYDHSISSPRMSRWQVKPVLHSPYTSACPWWGHTDHGCLTGIGDNWPMMLHCFRFRHSPQWQHRTGPHMVPDDITNYSQPVTHYPPFILFFFVPTSFSFSFSSISPPLTYCN